MLRSFSFYMLGLRRAAGQAVVLTQWTRDPAERGGVKCPFCADLESRVVDSRSSGEGAVIRRRRECQQCQRRYTTYERYEMVPRLVIKKDQRREPFNREKVLQGLLKACEKRTVSLSRLEEVVDLVERRVYEEFDYEVESNFVGEILIKELKKIDQVAYVRFASVYQEFADVSEFLRELKPLIDDSVRTRVEAQSGAESSPRKKSTGDGENSGQDPR